MASRGGRPAGGTYRFVHASDLHLDAPARGLGLLPEPLRIALRDASLHAWKRLVDVAIDREVAFVVLSGGLFDGPRATVRSCASLREGVRRLRAHGVDVFIAGTAQDLAATPQLSLFVEGATLLDRDTSTAQVRHAGDCLATIHGPGAVDAAAVQPSGFGVEIGVLPMLEPPGPARLRMMEMLAGMGIDYWALGGSARHAILREQPWIVCPGTVQGRSIEPDQLGLKGGVLVEVDGGRVGAVTLLPLDHVRFVSFDLDVSECTDGAAIRARLWDAVGEHIEHDGVHVVDVVLQGNGIAHGEDRFSAANDVVAALRHESAARGSQLWWARVRDRTARADRPHGAAPGDLRRIVIDRSEALGTPLPRGRFLAETFAPLLRRWETETDLEEQGELVRDAAALALDLVDADVRR